MYTCIPWIKNRRMYSENSNVKIAALSKTKGRIGGTQISRNASLVILDNFKYRFYASISTKCKTACRSKTCNIFKEQ